MRGTFTLDDAGRRFLGAAPEAAEGEVALLGVPYDGTTSFRPGARFGPGALREASDVLETYSPVLDRDLEDRRYADLGDLEVPFGAPDPVVDMVEAAARDLLGRGIRPVLLGGEHSPTTGAIRAAAAHHPDLVVVQLDAHADLRESYLGSPHNHACTMRRCLEIVGSGRLIQVGIRSGTRAEFTEMREAGRLVDPEPEALARALEPHRGSPVYLTLDLDVFDPGVMGGTGTPEPGGLLWSHFAALLPALTECRLVAADVMELAPALDPTGASSVLAAKVTREVMLLLQS
ncbi:MAG: agmatinase [Myxococcota bacterium]